jgi:hypothetical protein
MRVEPGVEARAGIDAVPAGRLRILGSPAGARAIYFVLAGGVCVEIGDLPAAEGVLSDSIPPGSVTVIASGWELEGEVRQTVTVGAGETVDVVFR